MARLAHPALRLGDDARSPRHLRLVLPEVAGQFAGRVPVDSGKAAAGLVDLVRSGHFPGGSNVLFLHTGGSPALYAYMDTFRQA